jgi:nitrite reductase/ring-hydroxylating ferredoxin subunit
MDANGLSSRLTFNGLLLAGVILSMAMAVGIALFLYLVPGGHLQLPELQPFARVAREAEFPVGASRVVNWGDQIILVVRRGEHEYSGLEGTSPTDGCILEWDAASLRVISPCTYLVYDVRGNVVAGLTTAPLKLYPVYVRGGVIYVTT